MEWTAEVERELAEQVSYAVSRARRRYYWWDKDEIEAAAWFGAFIAFSAYEPRGYTLGSYAKHRIVGQIMDDAEKAIKRYNRGVEMPWRGNDRGYIPPSTRRTENKIDVGHLLSRAKIDRHDLRLIQAYYWDGLTMREIAIEFEVHESCISQWLARARKRLRAVAKNLTPTA